MRLRNVFFLLLCLLPFQSNAASVTHTFIATVSDGALAGASGTGNITYDDSLVIFGGENITAENGLEVDFTFDGQEFTEVNDLSYPTFPQLDFIESDPDTFSLLLVNGVNDVFFTNQNIKNIYIFDDFVPSAGSFDLEANLNVSFVPVPAALPLLISAFGVLGFYQWRRKRR